MRLKTIVPVAMAALVAFLSVAQIRGGRPNPPAPPWPPPPAPSPRPPPPLPPAPLPTPAPAFPYPNTPNVYQPVLPLPTTARVAGMGVIEPPPAPPAPPEVPLTFRLVVEGDNLFAADLYAVLAAKDKGNLCFSPVGVEATMAGAYAGTAGDTARQLAQVLRFTLPPDKLGPAFADLLAKLNGPPVRAAEPRAYQLVLAGSLWRQKGLGLSPEFIQRLRAGFGTDVNTADFAQAEPTRKALNDWAARQTKDRIKDLAPAGALSAQARLVLAGAACFHSGWQEKFPKDETQDGPFQLSADQSVRVMLMHLRKRFDYAQSDGLQMLELPYAGGELSMLLFLPHKADGLAEMEQGLSGGTIDQWIRDKRSSAVDVTLPRFSLAGEFLLAGTIKDMGVTDVFDPDRADLSTMGVGGKGWVSQVVHKALVSVDEEGTDALPPAAERAGSAEMIRLDNPKVFRADHPFVFVVRHNATGQILFMGRVANPKPPG